MTRQQHLEFCKVCTHQKKDLEQGIVCGLTDRIADFEGNCASFVEDTMRKETLANSPWNSAARLKTASQGKRFVNYIVDRVCVYVCAVVFYALFVIIESYVSPDGVSVIDEDNRLLDYAVAFTVGVFYYAFFEGVTNRSIGKYFTKTKVVDENGNKPPFGSILARSFYRFVPFDAFSFLGEGVGWHDRWSKTRVVEIDS
ncbi:RDD family protein [Spongiimicrobium salis]|uniref:RDD family protein n=1 Tax=Spongiimicrobium salis TaxID=1667022 RepID=UPI00374CDB3E